MDCGPTCLAIIARHYNVKISRQRLRELCDLGREGSSLLGISKDAESLGFKTLGGRLDFNTLVDDVPLPCIVHWEQNHFVVVKRIEKKRNGRYSPKKRRLYPTIPLSLPAQIFSQWT